MAHRPGTGPTAIGFAASVGAHAVLFWWLAVSGVAFPRPDPPPAPPRLVIFPEPLADAPPPVRIPPPSTPVARPDPPPAAEEGSPAPPEPPEVIPHDVPPRLLNGSAILSALESGYPADLPEAARRSLVTLWLFVDESGQVTKLRVQGSSGYEELDRLATEVAPRMRYRPALHQGRRVAVWVAQRIRFRPSGT